MRNKGQSTLEYGVVIAVAAAALLAMSVYMKRGVQGKLRTATDDMGGQFVPKQTSADHTVHSESKRSEVVISDGTSTSTLTNDEIQFRHGEETVTTSGETKLFE